MRLATTMINDGYLKPLVYACSGCSSGAHVCHDVAVSLDSSGLAEMSCIAGVGGKVEAMLELARSGRRIIALDACSCQCVRRCLNAHGIEPDQYIQLQDCEEGRISLRDSVKLLHNIYEELGFALPRNH